MTPLRKTLSTTTAPILCSQCPTAARTIYGPTVCGNASIITNIRKEIYQHPARKTILHQGEASKSVYSLQRGWAFQSQSLKDGRHQILSFLIPGDIIPLEGLFFQHYTLPFSVKSLTPITLCEFEIDALARVLSATSEQKANFQKTVEQYFARGYRRLGDIGRRSAAGRIAQLIFELGERSSRGKLTQANKFEFPLRQEHIADATGLSTIHVNRTLVAFRAKGLIRLDHQELTVLDLKVLKGIAENK